MRFQDKVVIVTGATGGIGAACAERFGREGARVVLVGRNAEKGEANAGRTREAGAPDAAFFACDVGDEAQVRACADFTLERFGRLDVIVNNAGLMEFKALSDLTRADWLRALDVDVLGAFSFLREAFARMPDGGAVVNVSSVHAVETEPLVAPYAACKAALMSLTRSAAIEGKEKGIRVNAVLPGAIDTPMLRDNPNVKSGAERVDPADVGQPADVADVVAFLASDDARFVWGAALAADGGRLARL